MVLVLPSAAVYVSVTLYIPPANEVMSMAAGAKGEMDRPSSENTVAPLADLTVTSAAVTASPVRTLRVSTTGLG